MASFRFIHCADLHIDSPLRGLEADPDAPIDRIRSATRDAFVALVSYAIANRVDFVLAAGDLYDGEWQDWRTGQFLVREVGRLSQAGIPFIAIRGNHDAQSIITRQLNLRSPAVLLAADKVETWRLPQLDVVVHGQSFANAAVKEDLTRGYPAPEAGQFNIGLLHSNVNGLPGHENYAPSNLIDLQNHGYSYWALGHVHGYRVLSEDPWVIYPGNLQGRHVRETGPKGAMLVTVTDRLVAGPPVFLSFDTVRWDQLLIDVSDAADEDAVLALARDRLAEALGRADGRLLAVRIRLVGATPAYAALNRNPGEIREKIRAEALALAGQDDIWIEGVSVAVAAPRVRGVLPGMLAAEIERMDFSDIGATAAKYSKDLLDRVSGLRDQLGEAHAAVAVAADGALPPELLERARALLLARLAEG
jgi:DNA repair protein SbcD/Mre11